MSWHVYDVIVTASRRVAISRHVFHIMTASTRVATSVDMCIL